MDREYCMQLIIIHPLYITKTVFGQQTNTVLFMFAYSMDTLLEKSAASPAITMISSHIKLKNSRSHNNILLAGWQ